MFAIKSLNFQHLMQIYLKLTVVLLFKLLLFQNTTVYGQISPCPEVFEYIFDGTAFHGIVTLPALKGSNNVEIETIIIGNFNQSDRGGIEVSDTKSEAIKRFINGGNIHYKLTFPKNLNNIPNIFSIKLNNQKYCDNPKAESTTGILFILKNSLKIGLSDSSFLNQSIVQIPTPISQITDSPQRLPEPISIPLDFPAISAPETPLQPSINIPSISNISDTNWLQTLPFSDRCGKHDTVVHTIINGRDLAPNELPWLVALFNHNRTYFCGGSLISDRHVITAAHCTINQKWIFLEFGKHSLRNRTESGVAMRISQNIFNQRDYVPNTGHGDIAVIVISEKVTFTEKIKPICLWPFVSHQIGEIGTVAGWGYDLSGATTDTPMAADVDIVSDQECLSSNTLFATISSNTTFCAGGKNKGPCSGDSGSGFIVYKDGRWYLKGVISVSLTNNPRAGTCDVNKFAVYTDVGKYLGWLKQYLI